jgi:hypothetical protein
MRALACADRESNCLVHFLGRVKAAELIPSFRILSLASIDSRPRRTARFDCSITNRVFRLRRRVTMLPGAGRKRVASATEVQLLNRTDRPSPMPGEAEVKYLDGDFRVVRPGAFVRCAVTSLPISLEELRYWSVDLQEAYVSPEAVLQRHGQSYCKG